MKIALLIVELVLGLLTCIVILMQPSKSDALSGLIQGSNNETFFSKNKARTKEVMLERITVIGMIVFVGLIIALNLI